MMDTGSKRGFVERWLDRHNHKMAMLRTVFSLIAALTGILVFLRVFDLLPS